jgi:hypothetical protein
LSLAGPRRAVVLVVGWLAGAGLALSGCAGSGEDGSAPPSIPATLRAAIAAFDARDAEALCERLSRKGRLVVGFAVHGSLPIECPEDVKHYLGALRPYGNGWRSRVMAVDRSGPDRAVATFVLPDGMRATIPLRREEGDWRLDGLFDADMAFMQVGLAPPDDPQPIPEERLLMRKPRDLPDPSGAVGVRDQASGRECPPVDLTDYPDLSGGCAVNFAGVGVRITLHGPFGFSQFARCRVSHTLRVDGRGRAWVDDYRIAGPSPCLDTVPCRYVGEEDDPPWVGKETAPWPARIEPGPGGVARLAVDACFDTCIGHFAGRWRQDLDEHRGGWRLSSDSMVGTSGWRLDGALAARGRSIAIAADPRERP